jgi:GNAT superfamily N-acetyltransferase
VTPTHFVASDPEQSPASELLAEMSDELNRLYWTTSRLTRPALSAAELRAPGGIYLVGRRDGDDQAVAGGGLRRLTGTVAEIKRMYVRPPARAQGVAAELLAALEDAARALGYRRVRLDTGPKQGHAQRLYRGAGYADIAPYNDNPFASFWGEKALT